MQREILETAAGVLLPASLLGDTSARRIITSVDDPSTLAGLTIVTNDIWQRPVIVPVAPALTGVAKIMAEAGVPAGTVLTPAPWSSGNYTFRGSGNPPQVSGSGTSDDPWVLEYFDLGMTAGILASQVGNVVVRNCRVHSSFFGTTDTGIVNTTSGSVPHGWDAVLIEYCDIYADSPSFWLNGVFGHGVTIDHCNIYHVTDGIGTQVAFNSGEPYVYAKITNNWVHGLSFFEGAYAPQTSYASGGSPKSNTSIPAVNPGGDPGHPDGTHNDCWQPQNGGRAICTNNFFDATFDASLDSNGVRRWMRKSSNFAPTDPLGNSDRGSPWGTYNANAAIQYNNVTASAPLVDYTVDGNYFRGGRFATVNWGPQNSGSFAGHTFTNNTFLVGAGWTAPPWSTSGQFGYDTAGNPIIGAQPKSSSPGYPISVADGATVISQIAFGGNVMDVDQSATPWRGVNSTVVRSG
jgi:hypothetical protein